MGHGKLNQALTAVASAFGSFLMGMLYVWPSYTVSMLKDGNSTILSAPMTEAEQSLLGSLPSLGAMVGTAMVGPLIETFGRKMGGVALMLPSVLSWSIIGITKSSTMLLVARFIGGVSGGSNLVFAPMYISEVAEDSIRGTLASATVLFYGSGALLSYLLGWLFSYNMIVWINLGFSVLACGLLFIIAESPVYLLKKNREEDARTSLAVYRGLSANSSQIFEEISKMRQQLRPAYEMVSVNGEDLTEKSLDPEKEKLQTEDLNLQPPQKKSVLTVVKSLFLTQSSRRALFVVMTVISMQVIMGIVPVQVYAKHVFMQADPLQADMYSVIFAVVLVSGSLVPGSIADRAGRRVLIITSSTMVGVCMASLGYLLQSRAAPAWVTVAMLLMYCFFFMAGAGSVPYILVAEVFNPEVQALASTIVIEWVWFLNFLILAVFSYLNNLVGIHNTFYFFAINSILNATISFFIVPETKGLSNAQIQELFLRRRK